MEKIVVSKVLMQAAALESIVEISTPLIKMQRKITSGDITNIEAQAARYYWPSIMCSGFRRDLRAEDENALLNYG